MIASRFFSCLLALAIAAPALAQESGTEPPKRLRWVTVVQEDHSEIYGQLLNLSGTTMTIRTEAGPWDIPLARITQIDRDGDSIKNGAVIGALIYGLACAAVCPQGLSRVTPAAVAGLALTGAGMGLLLGAGIDAMRQGRTTIFRKNRETVAATPGVALTWRYRF